MSKSLIPKIVKRFTEIPFFQKPSSKFNLKEDDYISVEYTNYLKQNELETSIMLKPSEGILENIHSSNSRIHYISDIHLMHKFNKRDLSSKKNITAKIQKIIDNLDAEFASILLINGDLSSKFDVFEIFVELLSKSLSSNTKVIFTLGNHELWDFPELSLDEIVDKYRNLLNKYNMYLLHNDLLYVEFSYSKYGFKKINLLRYDEILKMNNEQISEILRNARYTILGGTGFSGYNSKFNADCGIYRKTIDRYTEIYESQKFEKLYNKLTPILEHKNTIILTHMPKEDWSDNSEYNKNFIYVSGHTHRNFFYDDGEKRIYADNQIGYTNNTIKLKTFITDIDYDCFANYKDGIFEITQEQYIDFYRGNNIDITCKRELNIIYMLKKNGYYCFIHKFKTDKLAILNGGRFKNLKFNDIKYYYNNMDIMISTIKSPLDEFTKFQKVISDMIKNIGGSGRIHGCIIDIDRYNHIYVNASDLSITAYYASNIIHKLVYPSIPALLKENCKEMFNKYLSFIEENENYPIALKHSTDIDTKPVEYLSTDIYKASREIKKMQKLDYNLLTYWNEETIEQKSLNQNYIKK